MMDTTIIRQQLHQSIESADEDLLKLMTALAENYRKQTEDAERKNWNEINRKNLSRFYAESEPEYSLNMLRETNPEYKNETR